MADRYTSRIALALDAPVDVGEVVGAAQRAGDIDRASPVRGQPAEAQEVHWGGAMQRGVVRRLTDGDRPLLRTEIYLGGDGLTRGMQRQALLLQALSRQLRGRITAVVDLSAHVDRDLAWMNRLTVGAVEQDDAIVAHRDGEGTWWVYTHGAARFDIPDLELYGLAKDQVDAAEALLGETHRRLLSDGLTAPLEAPDGRPAYLVPVLEAWPELPLDWPGVGRAGQDRGPGLDGPRATLSVLHKPRLGRYRKDFDGVLRGLAA